MNEKKEYSEPAIQITTVTSLSGPALIDYLKELKIDIELAKLYCKEVKYSVNDKPYYAIGFGNDIGGYVLRSKHFKGCTSNAITHLKNGSGNCLLFEGFMDFLSYLTLCILSINDLVFMIYLVCILEIYTFSNFTSVFSHIIYIIYK